MYYALEASIQQIYNLHIGIGQEDAAVACAGGRGGGAAGSPRPRHRQLLRQLRHLPQLPAGVQVSCDWSSPVLTSDWSGTAATSWTGWTPGPPTAPAPGPGRTGYHSEISSTDSDCRMFSVL